MNNNKWIPIGLTLFAVLVVFGGTWLMAQNGTMMPGMMWGTTTPFGMWGAALMQILMLVVFALAVAAVVLGSLWVVRNVFDVVGDVSPKQLPEEILQSRFARGEITREQFEEMRHALRA